ncbi:MAG: LysR substrate-binding domain-containing protein [Lacisediminimonas sp.]|nr:LysR substrate-binding domain-containing protein [Lacisediminimonas sp.]
MRKISLRHLRCFLAVAESGSFTVAASRLFQTQSSLTATIQQFEEAIGLKLFERTTRRVDLTPEAIRFRSVAEKLVRDFDNAIGDLHAIATSQRGHVRIAAAPSIVVHVLTPALRAFRQAFPEITISVQDAGSARIERAVLDGEVDFGIASRLKDYPELDYKPILRDPFGVIMPPEHPLAAKKGPVRWSALAGCEYIALTNDTGIGAFLENYPELGLGKSANPYDHASSTTSLYAMLKLGGKVSVLPSLAAQAVPMNEFCFRELTDPPITREICLITRHLRSFSPNTQRILDVLMETIRGTTFLNGTAMAVETDAEAQANR